MIEPQILLYDEPTVEFEKINTKIISDIILDLKNEKKITQLVVTHDVAFAKSIADILSILDDGKITLTTNKEGFMVLIIHSLTLLNKLLMYNR